MLIFIKFASKRRPVYEKKEQRLGRSIKTDPNCQAQVQVSGQVPCRVRSTSTLEPSAALGYNKILLSLDFCLDLRTS